MRTDVKAMVILSGGFDSVALLHLALLDFSEVRAVTFDYGQPHRDAEILAAQSIAADLGLTAVNGKWERIRLMDLGPFNVTPGFVKPKVARAFVPGRNLIFIAHANNRAALAWPGESSVVLYGANADDAAGFADCRRGFIAQASQTVEQSVSGFATVVVAAPWVERSWKKEDILKWAADQPKILNDLRRSMSCYVGTRCGKCDSCTRRRKAFEAVGLVDTAETGGPRMIGGDPQRSVHLPVLSTK